ncbi:glycosyltransferase family 4 protein [Salegentibacter sp. F14]
MNILHVSAVNSWGGGEKQIELLSRAMEKSYPQARNLILCARGDLFHQRLKKTNLAFLTAPLAFKVDPRFIWKLIDTCKREKTDLIHLHDPTALSLAVMADHFWSLPPFVFSKKTSFPIKQRKTSLYKYNYPKIKKIFCVSEATRSICAKSIRQPAKVLTLYHGIDLGHQQSATGELDIRQRYKIPEGKKIIGNIANHIRAKDLHTLIKTANRLINIEGRDDFHFVQIGNFARQGTPLLKRAVQQYGLEDHFSFLGFRENASALIPQFDFSVMTSQSEGLPQFIYESFYHRIPVISTAVGGVPEIIQHRSNGLLAPAHDDKKLCENILFLASNEELITKFARISYRKLITRHTSDLMAEKTFTEYKKILNERF